MSRLDSAGDAIDLVSATVDTLAGIVENDIFGVEFIDRRSPARRIVLTEDILKIAGEQGRYGVGHGCSFSSLGQSYEFRRPVRFVPHSRIGEFHSTSTFSRNFFTFL